MASLDLCRALLKEAQAVVVRRVSDEEVETMAASWYRAFQRVSVDDLEAAWESWFDSVGERRIDTLPTSGAVQVHLTARIQGRAGAVEEPTHWIPARKEFRAAHNGFRAQVETACRMERKVPHQHPRGVPSPQYQAGCPECARIDRVQALVAELEAELPDPVPLSPRRCTCFDGTGWVRVKSDPDRWYPCERCLPGAFFAYVAGGGRDDDRNDDEPKRLTTSGGKRKRK